MSSGRENSNPIKWMAGNSVAANLVMIFFLVGGLIFAYTTNQEVFPSFDMDMVVVTIAYPGASPEEVEQGIILSVEEAVRDIEGVKSVYSQAFEGTAMIQVEIENGEDLNDMNDKVKQAIDGITTLPEDSEKPQVMLFDRSREVLDILLYGIDDEKVLREVAENTRNRMLENSNLVKIDLRGGKAFEIAVEISEENLRKYNLKLSDVAAKIKNSSVEIPGGGIKTAQGEILVRMKERKNYGREFGAIPVITAENGAQILLRDIADIKDGFEESDTIAEFNGGKSISLDIYSTESQTPIEVAKTAKAELSKLEKSFPPGVHWTVRRDMSDTFQQRMDMLLKNAFFGMALVFILLGLFLEPRLAFWVTMGIPTSFLGAFIFLPAADVSINMISMFAFIISLGIVVDDAIVVGENIHSKREEGMSMLKAATEGAGEVAMPVIFSVLTNMVTFAPLLFVPGTPGKIFKSVPIVVITVFTISLIESIFVLPSHLGNGKTKKRSRLYMFIYNIQQAFSQKFSVFVAKVYDPFLDKVLERRYFTVAVAIGILVVLGGYTASGRLGLVMMPRSESDFAIVTAVLPYGSPVEDSVKARDRIVRAAEKVVQDNGGKNIAEGIFTNIGGTYNNVSGTHVIEVTVYMADADKRVVQTADFVNQWRKNTVTISGASTLLFESDRGGPGGASIEIEPTNPDPDVLEKATKRLAGLMMTIPNVKDVDDGFAEGKVQLDFSLLPEGESLGLTAWDVASQVRSSFYGSESFRQQRGRNEIKIVVRLPRSERESEYNLENMMIKTPSGNEVPLMDVVKVKRGRAYMKLSHRDGRRIALFSANVEPQNKVQAVRKTMNSEFIPQIKKEFPGTDFKYQGRQADIDDSMHTLIKGFILALLIIYALLAIPFKSYTQPLIIMVSIPFGIVGALLGHIMMGYTLSIISMLGIVALSGVVVNDSLVLIDFANRQRREKGFTARDAVKSAGVLRFRAVMLTTLTTFFGLMPMIFETSRQARMMIPMAISLGYGILFATFITLVIVPSLYVISEDIKGLFGVRGIRH